MGIKEILFILIFSIAMAACDNKIYFRTTDNLAWRTNESYISRYEVTVSDWLPARPKKHTQVQ